MTLIYKRHANFSKCLKQLLKKFRTLEEDITIAQKFAIELLLIEKLDNGSIKPVPGFDSKKIQIFKVRKFACRSLKGSGKQSGIRIIFAYFPDTQEVEYLEIYHKTDQENMDYVFAKEYFKSFLK